MSTLTRVVAKERKELQERSKQYAKLGKAALKTAGIELREGKLAYASDAAQRAAEYFLQADKFSKQAMRIGGP